ncbi:pyruvate:ferredoxin (flavodoxin) oxidoreductase [Aminipila luticellarii]|uniref:Pyruvate:ferredoxin oxidoreductase n=2 Tax=Aminipila luticellarii TaxID=2507160 RepID=A0A410PYV1_9FIRM|nr:pyruvate:ferredoxin (flavodoxin) oxidoreductase [Aminipila luticellarii]
MDGNTAAAHVAYAFSEVAAIYPITPSSVMAENIDEWASEGRKNIFGEQVKVLEMQSEGGAAGAVHGSLAAGAYTSTFTASQGLLLMIPNMYKLAGEETPAVLHVAARALASHALSIFGDHSDVMGCRSTGFAMLASNNPQEVMDLASVAHLSAIAGKVPMLHFFDGFRTSHEQQKIEVWDYDELKSMVDWEAVAEFRRNANHPMHPHSQGSAEQPETFFQHREASNKRYEETAEVVVKYMNKVNEKLGTDYKPFNYYGAPDATEIIIAIGSVCDAAEEVIDYLNAKGKKTGMVKVHLYRPFSTKYLLEVIPETVKSIAVLDRTKEPGAIGEPLYLDVVAALRETAFETATVVGGRYGLGSKDVQPGDLVSVYENLWMAEPKKQFTISIEDDVTGLSLPVSSNPDTTAAGTVSCKFWGLGADGTVGANKNSIKIIGDHTNKKVQAYFQYDSKKSGGITISHLRFGDQQIKSTYYVKQADFVACHHPSYMKKYDIVQDVKPGGFFLLNCPWTDEELEEHLPAAAKRYIAKNNIQFYTCDAVSIAMNIGLGARRTNTVLQAAFFKLANIIPIDEAVGYMKDAIKKTYGAKGDKIVNMNLQAVDAGAKHIHKVEIPKNWADAEDLQEEKVIDGRDKLHTDYIKEILIPTNAMRGDSIPVSKFMDSVSGFIPSGTAAFEKRGIAVEIPKWLPENCMQCNWCSYSCPHGVIRPFVMDEKEAEESGAKTVKMKGCDDKLFSIAVSALDCTGCGSCASVCPARNKALEMIPAEEGTEESQKVFDYAVKHVTDKVIPFKEDTVKGSQFKKPLLEFSGACPGCGESPYAKLITQLYGDRMFIANATGCSSIWGCSAPSTPYTVNKQGRGPAWANSLFEDNAEFGLGLAISMKTRRQEMKSAVTRLAEEPKFKEAAWAWIKGMDEVEESEEAGNMLLELCRTEPENEDAKYVAENRDMLPKPSIWMFGGDGWAYDIGYGGLDHVIASGENVNILVFDTEVYSNTGGQASKATPVGAVAQFSANGKAVRKKNLAQIAMSYEYVYVAQIAMGANPDQALKAIREAESYDGPSLIIAYAPCISHGIKAGMNKSMFEMKRAVRAGYWNLLRYNPELAAAGKNPLSVDSPVPTESYNEFIMGEVRYNSLTLKFPDRAKRLFAEAEDIAMNRYNALIRQKKSLEPQEGGEQ